MNGRTLVDILTATTLAFPDAPALADENVCLTYRELSDQVHVLVDRLAAAGVTVGDRVGIRIPSGTCDLYLGILAALSALPSVSAAACAVHKTATGAPVLVGYVVPTDTFDEAYAREILTRQLPAGLVPRLVELPALPMKTSGKVDRGALPWPLNTAVEPFQTPTEEWLGSQWALVLGVQAGRSDHFFALGGGSLAAARLVSLVRKRFPTVSVPDVYQRPDLPEMAAWLDSLHVDEPAERTVLPTPRHAGMVQAAVQFVLFTVTGVKWVLALMILNDLIDLVDPDPWAPETSWWIVLGIWIALVSPIGRLGIVYAGTRLLRRGITPGEHPRGGRVHLRLWTLERIAVTFGMSGFTGTHWASRYARVLGSTVGEGVILHSMPPVTGLAVFGDRSTVEPEVDLAGWWLDGDVLHVGAIHIGADARIGARSTVAAGSTNRRRRGDPAGLVRHHNSASRSPLRRDALARRRRGRGGLASATKRPCSPMEPRVHGVADRPRSIARNDVHSVDAACLLRDPRRRHVERGRDTPAACRSNCDCGRCAHVCLSCRVVGATRRVGHRRWYVPSARTRGLVRVAHRQARP